jgi:hypothetical protein
VGSLPLLGAGGSSLGPWRTTFSQSLSIDSSGWNGFNMRNVISNAVLSDSGSRVRLTLVAGSAAQAVVDGAYIWKQALTGDSYDGLAASGVPILVSGSQSFTIPSGTEVVTDEIIFDLDETLNLITAFHFGGVSTIRGENSVANVNEFSKSAANEVSTADVTGYAQASSAIRMVRLIEVRG